MKLKRRGRPLGFRLSDTTKMAISLAKQGQRHREETKEKISRSLIAYFRSKKPLSEEIIRMYCRADDDETCEWIMEVREFLDDSREIKTYRAIANAEVYERTASFEIENVSHNMNPELLLLFKEYCELNSLTTDDAFDSLNIEDEVSNV